MKIQFKSSKNLFLVSAFVLAFSIFVSASSTKVYAAGCSWNGSSSANWNTAANWDSGCTGAGGIPGTGDNLTFDTGSNKSMNNNISSLTLGSMTFMASGYSISGNTITLNGGTGTSSATATISAGLTLGADQTFAAGNYQGTINLNGHNLNFLTTFGDVTFSGSGTISGSGNINSGGGHDLILSRSNSFIGTLTIISGDVRLSNSSGLGNSANLLHVMDGHNLIVSGGLTVPNPITLQNSTTLFNSAGTNTFSGTINIIGVVTFDTATSTTLVLSGVVANSGAFVKTSTGQIVLSGTSSNTYAGGLFIHAGQVGGSKTGGAIAFPGNIIVGDDVGAAASAILYLDQNDQVDDSGTVSVVSDGLLSMVSTSELFHRLEITTGRAEIDTGFLVVYDLQMIEGAVDTGSGKLGVAHSMSLSGDSTQATIDGVLDFGAIMGGVEIAGANSGQHPDAIINADIRGSSTLYQTSGDIRYRGQDDLFTGDFVMTGGEAQFDDLNDSMDVFLNGAPATFGGRGIIKSLTSTGGFIAPGHSPGQMVINEDMILNSATTTTFELDGLTQGVDYDYIQVLGNISLDNATLVLDPGTTFTLGDSFTILTAVGNITGTFADLPEGHIVKVGSQYFRVHYGAHEVTLEVVLGFSLFNPSFTSSVPTPYAGQRITITSVWTSDGPTATGNATLFDGSTNLGTVALVGGVATFNNIALSAGSHSLTVQYDGDSNFGGAISNPLVLGVGTLSDTGIHLPIELLIFSGISSLGILLFISRKSLHSK